MSDFQIEELHNAAYYALFAPDGSFQAMTLAPDFVSCAAMIKMIHKAGLTPSFHELCKIRGYKILPIALTIIPFGTENKPFKDENCIHIE